MSLALWHCIRCGECCKNMVGRKFGAAITPQEKQRLEILASRRCIRPHFAPLTSNGFGVTLWQFVDEICPFLDKKTNQCMVYQWRPLLCKMYPLHAQGVGRCSSLSSMQRRGFRVVWPPGMLNSGKEYVATVLRSIKGASKRYNLALGKWERNYSPS